MKSVDSSNIKLHTDLHEINVNNSREFMNTEFWLNDHSYKKSISSVKSLPMTSLSISTNAELKMNRAEKDLQDSKDDLSRTQYAQEIYGEDPHELVTNEIPQLIWCAFCKAEMKTTTVYANSSTTLCNSISIFLFGGVLGCFLFPYVCKDFKEAKTVCTKCGHMIGLL